MRLPAAAGGSRLAGQTGTRQCLISGPLHQSKQMDDTLIRPLLGSTLALVAHPDDEVIVCGALMQRMQRAVVVFATDGAPRRQHFWQQYGSRHAYAAVRRQEARQALAT